MWYCAEVCLTEENRNSAENQPPDIQARPQVSKLARTSAMLIDVNGVGFQLSAGARARDINRAKLIAVL